MSYLNRYLLCITIFCVVSSSYSQTGTQLILLGTGTPFSDPDRSGPSVAIVVNSNSYIVDCGPGVVRRASAAYQKGIIGLQSSQLKKLFITHLHSDHTSGYADFIFTPAVLDRNEPLEVFGPKGLQNMTDHLLQAYQEDMEIRILGLEYGNAKGYTVNVHQIEPGVIYKDSNITVKAFRVKHGAWPEAFGYRFETKDKTIVVSGDCTFSEELIANAKGCDILVHEVYSMEGLAKREQRWKDYHATFHTSTQQLAFIANTVKPKTLVLIHQLLFGSTPESLMKEIRQYYSGVVLYGNDLDIVK